MDELQHNHSSHKWPIWMQMDEKKARLFAECVEEAYGIKLEMSKEGYGKSSNFNKRRDISLLEVNVWIKETGHLDFSEAWEMYDNRKYILEEN